MRVWLDEGIIYPRLPPAKQEPERKKEPGLDFLGHSGDTNYSQSVLAAGLIGWTKGGSDNSPCEGVEAEGPKEVGAMTLQQERLYSSDY